jgi:hypothetical protein
MKLFRVLSNKGLIQVMEYIVTKETPTYFHIKGIDKIRRCAVDSLIGNRWFTSPMQALTAFQFRTENEITNLTTQLEIAKLNLKWVEAELIERSKQC